MKICKNCKQKIDEKATKCSHCQTDQGNWFRRHPILTGLVALSVFGIVITSGDNKTPNESTESTTTETENKLNYEILNRNENNVVENYKVLIGTGEDGTAVAMAVKESCKKPCNIDVFDDKEALNLEVQYDNLISSYAEQSELDSWKKKNYVFVADHLLGNVNFETGEYYEYPYKDWYYKQQKGE